MESWEQLYINRRGRVGCTSAGDVHQSAGEGGMYINAIDHQAHSGDLVTTHVPMHLLAFPSTARGLAVACGSEGPVALGVTVRGRLTLEAPAFHSTLEALANTDACNVDKLPRNKVPCIQHGAGRQHGVFGHAKLVYLVLGQHTVRLKVQQLWLLAFARLLICRPHLRLSCVTKPYCTRPHRGRTAAEGFYPTSPRAQCFRPEVPKSFPREDFCQTFFPKKRRNFPRI